MVSHEMEKEFVLGLIHSLEIFGRIFCCSVQFSMAILFSDIFIIHFLLQDYRFNIIVTKVNNDEQHDEERRQSWGGKNVSVVFML